MCKRGNVLSLAVLIGRGLDHKFFGKIQVIAGAERFLFDFEGARKELTGERDRKKA